LRVSSSKRARFHRKNFAGLALQEGESSRAHLQSTQTNSFTVLRKLLLKPVYFFIEVYRNKLLKLVGGFDSIQEGLKQSSLKYQREVEDV
jgi:hypothetical protein